MIFTLQRSLIILLVLLQLVAPLVHAHSGQVERSAGIHLPGLEFVTASDKSPFLSTTPSSPVKHYGTLVSVSSGIQHKNFSRASAQEFNRVATDIHYYAVNSRQELICLPDGFIIPCKTYLHPDFPRAPPSNSV